MRVCQGCGKGLEDQARFCSQCGAVQVFQNSGGHFPAQSGNPLERAIDFANRTEDRVRRLWPLWLALSLLATALFIGGLLYFLGQSEPAKMTSEVLRRSPVVRQAIGEIQAIGWANGGITTRSGGSGTANFTVSVKGSLAEGKFYAYFQKRHDLWQFESGRLRLDDGRSISIPPP